MAYAKRSAIVQIFEAEDGFHFRTWKWNQSPPPITVNLANVASGASVQPDTEADQVAATLTKMKQELGSWLDTDFA